MSYLPEHDPYLPPRAPIGLEGSASARSLGGERPPADHIEGSPLLTIWTEPRSTMRTLLDTRPTYGVLAIAALLGLNNAVSQYAAPGGRFAQNNDQTPGYQTGLIVGAGLASIVLGVIGIYLGGWILGSTGRWLKGRGSNEDVRAAMTWGSIPAFPSALATVVCLLAFGRDFFNPLEGIGPFYTGYLAVGFFFGVWSFFTFMKCLGEAHLFSAWKAFGACLLAGLAFVGICMVIGVGAALVMAVLKPA